MRFMHIADIHLGYQQYGLTERFNDFGRMFLHLVDVALAEKVNFVLLAGDLSAPPSLAIEGMRRFYR